MGAGGDINQHKSFSSFLGGQESITNVSCPEYYDNLDEQQIFSQLYTRTRGLFLNFSVWTYRDSVARFFTFSFLVIQLLLVPRGMPRKDFEFP